MQKLLIEAIVVGIMLVVVSVIVANLLVPLMTPQHKFFKTDLTFIIVMFVTGVIVHLLCEATGVNRWYCKNGNACK